MKHDDPIRGGSGHGWETQRKGRNREEEGRTSRYGHTANHEYGIDVDKMDYIKGDIEEWRRGAANREGSSGKLECQANRGHGGPKNRN